MNRAGFRIIVVGAGKVGKTITKRLTDEGHNLIVIDKSEAKLSELSDQCDCMPIAGSGASHTTLQEAGITDADLMIAVTDSDELNLLCCTIAKQFNPDISTIARVRNPDYGNEIPYLMNRLAIDRIINPEYEAAVEAARLLFLPAAISINSFAHGSAEIVKIMIPEGSIIDDKSIAYLGKNITNDLVIVGVERDGELTIPNGDFVLKSGDVISFVSSRKVCLQFLKKIGFNTKSVHNTMIIGGGKSAYYLADQLIKSGINVRIIEKSKARCEELSLLLPKALIINGDGTESEVLAEVGITTTDALVALTGIDEENIMLTLHAKQVSKAKVVTKINRITFTKVINNLNLGSVIYPKYITAETIISYVRAKQASIGSNVETVYQFQEGQAEAVEFKVKDTPSINGIPLKDLKLREGVIVSFIIHDGQLIIPTGTDCISEGDNVMIVTSHKGFTELTDILR
ncbi:MAG: Trk system potassium transporter TrkA [Clostridiales bacterium]|nr:Trk system potassium transporter TrkA [Clostridiales bacterium]